MFLKNPQPLNRPGCHFQGPCLHDASCCVTLLAPNIVAAWAVTHSCPSTHACCCQPTSKSCTPLAAAAGNSSTLDWCSSGSGRDHPLTCLLLLAAASFSLSVFCLLLLAAASFWLLHLSGCQVLPEKRPKPQLKPANKQSVPQKPAKPKAPPVSDFNPRARPP